MRGDMSQDLKEEAIQDKYFVVSGLARSGTSAMMYALKWCGIPIIGYKFPMEFRRQDGSYAEGGSQHNEIPTSNRRNPDGFWEIPGVTKFGVTSRTLSDYNGTVIKCIADTLSHSDSAYLSGVIMMMRNPRKVMTSQLVNHPDVVNNKTWKLVAWSFVNNVTLALDWCRRYGILFKLVIYEQFIENPFTVLTDICAFIGKGHPQDGAKVIKKEYNKSMVFGGESEGMVEAEKVYDMACKNDIDGLLSYDYKAVKIKADKLYAEMAKDTNKVLV